MKKIWKLIIILALIAAIILLEVYVYINVKGLGGSC